MEFPLAQGEFDYSIREENEDEYCNYSKRNGKPQIMGGW